MAGGIDWFRWHHGSANDPKFRLVAKRAGARVGDVVAMWAMLLEQASANHDRGDPGNIDFETIDLALDMAEGMARAIHDAMKSRNLIDQDAGRVVAWERRQPKRERDPAPLAPDASPPKTSTERSREHRARKAANSLDCAMQRHATPCGASNSNETPREEERRVDISPSLRSGESADKPRHTSGRQKSECRTLTAYQADCKAAGVKPIPDDHAVRQWAADAGLQSEMLQIAWLLFRERYTEGEKGKGKRYKDWPAHFATAVKGNWFKLWFAGDNGMAWTSTGLTHKKVLDERIAQREAGHAPA